MDTKVTAGDPADQLLRELASIVQRGSTLAAQVEGGGDFAPLFAALGLAAEDFRRARAKPRAA